MATFTPRTTAPSTSNKYYIHKSKGGLGETILIKGNSVLPNCVGYCWSRAYECWGVKPKLSKGNAEDWYGHKDGYSRGSTPRLGAIICWRKGKAGYGKDGAGHVAFVEKVNSDGSILISNSNYSGTRFYTVTLKKPYKMGAGLTFQGFIYPPVSFSPGGGSGFRFDGLNYPQTVRVGNYYTLYGTVYSRLPLKRVEMGIVSSKTKRYVYHYDKKGLNQKSFNLHNGDSAMKFSKLARGTYYYRVWCWDTDGAHMVLNKKFTVK